MNQIIVLIILKKVKFTCLFVNHTLLLGQNNKMKKNLLLPNKYKRIGWFIFLPAVILGIVILITGVEKIPLNGWGFALVDDGFAGKSRFFCFIHTNMCNTVVGIFFIVGGLLVGFSKEKNEDEFIASLRQTSLLWALLVNYSLLLFCFAFVYGTPFVNVMIYNMFTVLIIFIVRFNFVLYRTSKSIPNEK
jgi:hypothetical protein